MHVFETKMIKLRKGEFYNEFPILTENVLIVSSEGFSIIVGKRTNYHLVHQSNSINIKWIYVYARSNV